MKRNPPHRLKPLKVRHLRDPERTCRSDLEEVEAALQIFPSQARVFPHTSTESRTGISRQIRFSGAVSHSTVIDSHEQHLAVDSLEVNSSKFRGEQPSHLTRSTLLYDPSTPPRRQESHDTQVYIQGCLTCCQFQPSQPLSQPPLQ
ncbi:hypothetical protein ILYODFUR_032762 [Ilyodon furcidens]|uniref:Uncharacterized protein n=1 Tax=Ilyodon furcidens TaxID=33524 RepID=A0ABV0VAY0_9TELE